MRNVGSGVAIAVGETVAIAVGETVAVAVGETAAVGGRVGVAVGVAIGVWVAGGAGLENTLGSSESARLHPAISTTIQRDRLRARERALVVRFGI